MFLQDMSSRYTIKSAFDMERGRPQEELRRAQQQRVHLSPARGARARRALPRARGDSPLPPPRLHLRWRRHLLRLGELELPRRRLLLLHSTRHDWLRRLRPHQFPNL